MQSSEWVRANLASALRNLPGLSQHGVYVGAQYASWNPAWNPDRSAPLPARSFVMQISYLASESSEFPSDDSVPDVIRRHQSPDCPSMTHGVGRRVRRKSWIQSSDRSRSYTYSYCSWTTSRSRWFCTRNLEWSSSFQSISLRCQQ